MRGMLKRFRQQGFDRSSYNPVEKNWTVRCSRCEALVINGNATHEHGCPNERRSRASQDHVLKRFRQQGFDESSYNPAEKNWTVRCSQCEALVINGYPTHERGCPNERRSRASQDHE